MLKLGDVGMAVPLEHPLARSAKHGTSMYTAPEVYEGSAQMKSDVWSLGISLLELADGKNPFAGCSEDEVSVVRLND